MDASVVGIRLASGVVTPLVKKLFRGEGAGAGLVDRPVRISSYVSLREQRVLSRDDLRRLADKLVEEALRAPGERPLPPGEEVGVATALAVTLYSLGDLALEDAQAVEMGARAFAAELRKAAPATGLGRDAELFHDRLLETTCLHVLHFFTTRSTYIPAALVGQAHRQAETIAKIDALLARIPRQDGRDAEFEARYLQYLVKRHSTLTIFGLDLPPGSARWPLEAAYVSLEAVSRPRQAGGTGRGGPDGGAPVPAQQAHAFLTGDEVLGYMPRALLRGEAGSGKTTLIKWLAVSASRDLADAVPYVLPLRTLTRHGERLPAAKDFLAATALSGQSPEGWEDRVLSAGRGLILIDGIDEIPEGERALARGWLTDLLAAYPGNRWLVTSRPSAVRQDWLADEEFTEVALVPMSRADVAAFVTRWHRAAEAGEELRNQLLASLAAKPELARLATSPLLCGLICALHRERRGFLPAGRKELYTAALSMMLHGRDRERELRLTLLAEEPQLQLLQRLAYWLIRNGRTEIGWDRATALIADALPAVPAAQALGDAEAVLRHFLERTGLLRAPTEDTLEFIHRTFQDFLGARAALDEGSLGELTRQADDDQWEDVIRMAVAQGRPRDRAAIIGDLLVRGSDRAVLLALASLEYAAELEPELREDVRTAAQRLIPPVNKDAADMLGRIGPLILDLLPPGEDAHGDSAALSVTAAVETGAEEALGYLAGYCRHSDERVREALVRGWRRFDAHLYAAQVLAHMEPPPDHVVVDSEARLAALTSFTGPPGLFFGRDVGREALAGFLARQPVSGLTLWSFDGGTDAEFLRGHTSLRRLQINGWPELADLSPLYGLPVEEVSLYLGNSTPLGPAIASWPRLRMLVLTGSNGPWSFRDFSGECRPERLELTGVAPDLAGLGRLRSLRVLALGFDWRPSGAAAWTELSALRDLEVIELHPDVLEGLAEFADLPSLREVRYYDDDKELDPEVEERVLRRFPRARMHFLAAMYDI
ncbi:NACHT domain-containing NTPase [Streptomyces sp. AP-93]|uniref:NACHT domain-containing protein n=1 Tax=Streptomyces sp. AP-93 TaxID=2929048 RepID=UPI001FAFE072|nr:NACHT domain-containing protein [Streptomyces sp. AP-93]MCJ0873940.1 NACHT domain-containing protein [Streptomyces sp. AP-93]